MAGTTRAVFLSYRRGETRHIAGRLADRLTDRLGPDQVFMDVDTIEPGADFTAAIAREVTSCKILIVLIGPTWLRTTNRWRRRRLHDPDDFVVLEIRAALEGEIHIIPVLVDGAVMPDRGDLPEELQGLARRNAVRLDHDTFRSDITILLNAVERILSTPAQKTTEPTMDTDADEAAPTITTPKEPPQRAEGSDSLGTPRTGHEVEAGVYYSPLLASSPTPLPPTPWSRLRPRLLVPAAIVITLALAGSFVIFTTDNPPRSGGPALMTASTTPPVVTTVPVGGSPGGVAVAPDGRHVYITNPGKSLPFGGFEFGPVSVIDTGSNKVVTTVSFDSSPGGVAVSPDGRHVYVASRLNLDSGLVSVIDTDSKKIVTTVPVGGSPGGVAVSLDGRYVYVTNVGSGSVSVIDTRLA